MPGVDASAAIRAAEAAFSEAREALDQAEVARARGTEGPDRPVVEAALARAVAAVSAVGPAYLTPEDARALGVMRRVLEEQRAGTADDQVDEHAAALRRLEARFAQEGAEVRVGRETVTRLEVLGRLAAEPDSTRRRDLFLALEPLWRVVDGDGSAASPYRRLIGGSVQRWAGGRSPIAANADALGVSEATVEAWCVAILDAWRQAVSVPATRAGREPVEPWDWWWTAGEAERMVDAAIPLEALRPVNDAYLAALGAEVPALGIRYDLHPRPGRPPLPVAFTTFGSRPRESPDGTWAAAEPWVFASYTRGGLGELVELVHESGHALHVAAVRTRPAFADWPDSDALSEAIGDLIGLDPFEPAWQRRWLGSGAAVTSEAAALRARYAAVALDTAWALFEIRLHAEPDRPPNLVWTEITGHWLGIAPHPEWSWWAMRGQLVQEPGYMANYAVGAVLAADLRTAIRAARGSWLEGDEGWYPWVSERLLRFGLERPSGEVVAGLLGRAPSPDALCAEIARIGG